MERVTGIGGIFFRAKDPKALTKWYAEHLGVEQHWDTGSCFFAAKDPKGQTIWSPHGADTGYFGTPQSYMINYRVTDLDAMLGQLRAAGVPVDEKVDDSEYGKFGWATDPEGNRFELWQPPAEE